MPRIPVRVEPYTNPQRQQRHYRSKRDILLRHLSKASYINGSQFAIMWVTARGEAEFYGTPAFQPKLDEWFDDALTQDAIQTAKREEERVASQLGAAERDYETMLEKADGQDEDESDEREEDTSSAPASQPEPISVPPTDPSLFEQEDASRSSSSPPATTPAPFRPRKRRALVDETTFEKEDQVFGYLHAKVNELTQVVCKIVVKSWIKAIEPKKSVNYPYAGREATKPPWWPAHLRHEEPDRLLKAERIELIVNILVSPYANISLIALATGEFNAFITPEKHILLQDIYAVARAFENMLKVQGDGIFAPFSVSHAISAAIHPAHMPSSPPKVRKKARLTKDGLGVQRGSKATQAMAAERSPDMSHFYASTPDEPKHVLVPSLEAEGYNPEDYFAAHHRHHPIEVPHHHGEGEMAHPIQTPWRSAASSSSEAMTTPMTPHPEAVDSHLPPPALGVVFQPAKSPFYEQSPFFGQHSPLTTADEGEESEATSPMPPLESNGDDHLPPPAFDQVLVET